MADIGAARGVSAATVSRRINDAVTQLRAKLRNFGLMVGAGLLYDLLQDNVAHAVPAAVTRELGKMALAGREAATGLHAATAATGVAAGLKVTMAALGIIAAAGTVMMTAQRGPKPEVSVSVPNEPNVTARAASDPNTLRTERRMPPARQMSTPAPMA